MFGFLLPPKILWLKPDINSFRASEYESFCPSLSWLLQVDGGIGLQICDRVQTGSGTLSS